jgi:hypothetical protein
MILIQLTGLDAVQAQPVVALTLICCVVDAAGTCSADGEAVIEPGT